MSRHFIVMWFINSLSEIVNYLNSSDTINFILLLNNYIPHDTNVLELILSECSPIEQAILNIGFIPPNTIVLFSDVTTRSYAYMTIKLQSFDILGEARFYLHARLPYCFDVDEFDERLSKMNNYKKFNIAQEICTIFRNDFSREEYEKLVYLSLELLKYNFVFEYTDNIVETNNKYKLHIDKVLLNRILIEANSIYELYEKINKIVNRLNKVLNRLGEFIQIIKYDQGINIYIVNRIEKTVINRILQFIAEIFKQVASQYYDIDLSTKTMNYVIMYTKDFNEAQFMVDNTILKIYKQISSINELI